MEIEKIGFFKRIKIAIFNLEKYSIFSNEKFSKALKYLFLLVLIVTLILALSSTIELSREAGKLIEYVKSDEFPNFELKEGNLSVNEKIDAYDEEYNARMIIDTSEDISTETLDGYKKEIRDSNYSVIFLKDKIVYRFDNTIEENSETTYNNLTSMFGISEINKTKLINDYLNSDNLFKLKIILYIYALLTIFVLNVVTLLEDIIIVGVFGWIASKIAKVPLTIGKTMSLAIYSLTLSIILSTIYSVVYSFTNFEIKYFEIMYMIIAYIYIVASIMIMKETNRTAGEAVTVEGQVIKTSDEEEKEDNKENDRDKKEKKKKLPEDEKDKNNSDDKSRDLKENEIMDNNENEKENIEENKGEE